MVVGTWYPLIVAISTFQLDLSKLLRLVAPALPIRMISGLIKVAPSQRRSVMEGGVDSNE